MELVVSILIINVHKLLMMALLKKVRLVALEKNLISIKLLSIRGNLIMICIMVKENNSWLTVIVMKVNLSITNTRAKVLFTRPMVTSTVVFSKKGFYMEKAHLKEMENLMRGILKMVNNTDSEFIVTKLVIDMKFFF